MLQPLVQRSIFSAATLESYLRAQYDLPTPVTCEFWNHSINDTYLVRAGHSRLYYRLAPASWRTPEQVVAELDLLTFLCEHGFSCPQAVSQRDGAIWQSVPAPEGERLGVLFSAVPGAPLESLTAESSEQYGRAVAEFHRVTDAYRPARAALEFDLAEMLDRPLERIQPLFRAEPADYKYLANLAAGLRQAVTQLPRTAPLFGMCHGDLNPSNFHLGGPAGWSLVDFEYSGWGWRVFDIATFGNNLLVNDGRTEESRAVLEAFLAGYEAVRPLESIEREALPAFILLRQLWLLGTSARYIPLSTVGAHLHRSWIFRQVMPFVRDWTEKPWQFT